MGGVTRRSLVVPWLAVAGLFSACGPGHGTPVATPTVTAHPAATETPTPPAQHLPLLAVLDHPFGAAPNTLLLLRADGGGEVGHVALDPDAESVSTSGALVLVAGAGRMHVYGADGSVVASVSLPGGPDSLVRGLIGDATATHLLWATVTQTGDSAVSELYGAGVGGTPSLVLRSTAAGRARQPLVWTPSGPVVSDEPLGIGGYVLFRRTFGPASLLDPGSGQVRALTDAGCAFSDMSADGSVACVRNGREAPNNGGAVTLHVVRAGGATPLDVALPVAVQQAGAALFSPDGRTLTLATSPVLGEGSEQVSMALVDVASGTQRSFGAAGLMPVAWLADGRLVAVRLPGVAGGDPGTYVLDSNGTATLISSASSVIGVLH